MAKVTKGTDDLTHLRGIDHDTLCGRGTTDRTVVDGELTCPECAKLALNAIELTTKEERRAWRKL